jgi:hypothetical protein
LEIPAFAEIVYVVTFTDRSLQYEMILKRRKAMTVGFPY